MTTLFIKNKYSLIASSMLLSLTLSKTTHAATDEWTFTTGLGVHSSNDAWKGAGSYQGVVPILSAYYGNWSIGDDAIFAYQLLNEDDFGLSAGINYRNDGYDKDKTFGSAKSSAKVFEGYKSQSGDVTFKVDGYWQFLNLSLEQDISGHSKGLTADLGVEIPLIELGSSFVLVADAGMQWASSNYNQYNYGINSKQVDNSVGRVAYDVGSTINYSVGLTALYQLNKDWDLIASAQYTKLDDAIADSPLIDTDHTSSVFLAATYHF